MRDIAPFISFEKVKKALKGASSLLETRQPCLIELTLPRTEQELSIGQLTSLRIEELAPNGRTASASMSSPNDLVRTSPSKPHFS